MTISSNNWKSYIAKLRKINDTAADKIVQYINTHGLKDTKELIDYAYAIVNKYGEASAALSAQMYDAIAEMSGALVPSAEVAEIAQYGDVAKAINGTLKTSQDAKEIAGAATRWVKMAGSDTTLKNGIRDRAEFAWIPQGETCAFCLTLASNGWQPISKKALKHGHAEHIHSNCDCQYVVRFSPSMNVEGYDPEKYKQIYDDAEGKSPKDKINSIRKMQYQENPDRIKAQDKENSLLQSGGKITGGHHYATNEGDGEREIAAAKKYEEFARTDDSELIAKNTGFSVEDVQQIRSHVFFEKHDLFEGYQRFAPDYDMAVAWKRLQNNSYLSRDITLLNHELLESQIEKEYSISASEAHSMAQKEYNWFEQLMKETNGKGENDGLL